jgi:hypothetical protein
MTEVSDESSGIRVYLESVIEAQRDELNSMRLYHNKELSELRKSLAASQAEIEELKHKLLHHRSLVHKHQVAAFNSTYAPSSLCDDSPRFFYNTPPISPPLAPRHSSQFLLHSPVQGPLLRSSSPTLFPPPYPPSALTRSNSASASLVFLRFYTL